PLFRSSSYINDLLFFFFFFQAEDGIRDFHVTGVQTCALPICLMVLPDNATPPADQDLVLADASSQRDYLKARLGAGQGRQRNLIVLATAAELDSPDLADLESQAVVLKPVQRGALYDALAAAGARTPQAVVAPAVAPAEALSAHVLLVEDEPVNAAVVQGYL